MSLKNPTLKYLRMKMEPASAVWFVWHLVDGRYWTGVFQTYEEALIAYECAIRHYPKVYLQKYVYIDDEHNLSNG